MQIAAGGNTTVQLQRRLETLWLEVLWQLFYPTQHRIVKKLVKQN
jgi:hypothetical protein